MLSERTNRVQELEAQLLRTPGDPEAWLELGDLYRELGIYQQAARCYEMVGRSGSGVNAEIDETVEIQTKNRPPTFNPLDFNATSQDEPPAWVKSRLSQTAGESATVCSGCLSVFNSTVAFHQGASTAYCPACSRLRQARSLERGTLVSLLVIGVGWVVGFGLRDPVLRYASLNLLFFFLLLYPLLLLHETAHAICALLLGGRVYRIQVGAGKPAWQGRLAGVALSLHWIPSSGLTSFGFPPAHALRARQAITILAGPLLNLVLLGLALIDFQASRILSGPALMETFFLANLFILLGSLLPVGDLTARDSIRFLRMLLHPDPTQLLAASYFLQESRLALERGSLDCALQFCRAGLEASPDQSPLNLLYGNILLELERPQEALDHFATLVKLEGQPPETRASAQCGIALACLQLQDPRAYDLAHQAFLIAPWLPAVQAAWGQALLALKEWPAAAHHLLQAAVRHPSTRARAACLAYAALAALGMDQRRDAETLIDRACRIDPKPAVVSAAAQLIHP